MMEREKPYRRPGEQLEATSKRYSISCNEKTFERIRSAAQETGMSMHKILVCALGREILAGGGR